MHPFKQVFVEAKLFRVVLPFMVGIAVSWLLRNLLLPFYSFGVLLMLFLCIGLVVVGRKRQKLTSLRYGGLLSVFFFLFGFTHLLHNYEKTMAKWPAEAHYYKAVVVETPHRGEKVSRCEVKVLAVGDSAKWRKTDASVILSVFLQDSVNVSVGDAVMFYGKVEELHNSGNPDEFDYVSWQQRKGVTGTLFAGNNYALCSSEMREGLWKELSLWQKIKISAERIRTSFTRKYAERGVGHYEQAVLSAMTLGDKYALGKDVRMLFAETGASHVLALSGLHLGILVGILLWLLRPLGRSVRRRWISLVICLLFIWSFTLLTGLNTSLVRAAVMYSLFLFFYSQQKVGVPLNGLALAALVILLFQPMALMDVGFQLSFLSVFAILFFQRIYAPVRPQRRWLGMMADFAFVALAAQIATAPLVAYYFHIFPLAFLLTNVLVIPCAYLILGGSMLFFATFPLVAVSQLLGNGLEALVQFMDAGLECISRIPFSSVELYPSLLTVLAAYMLVASLVFLWDSRSKNSMIAVMVMAAFCGMSLMHDSMGRKMEPQVIFYNVPSCPSVHFCLSAEKSCLWSPRKDRRERLAAVTSTFWKRNKIENVRFLEENDKCVFLANHQGIIQFMNKYYVLVNDNRWRNKRAGFPLKVEVLYLSAGCYTSLDELTSLFLPSKVVLDASLSENMRQKYLKEIARLKIPCYDIKGQGALIMRIDSL